MAAPPFRSVSATASIPNNLPGTVNVPAGVVDGDLMLLLVQTGPTGAGVAVSAPGWTLVKKIDSGQWAGGLQVWQRTASSEPASYSVDAPNASGNNSRAVIVAYLASTVSASSTTAAQSGTSLALATLTTPSAANRLVMFAAEINGRSLTISPPGTATSRASHSALTLSFQVCDEVIATAGAVGTRTFTTPSTADVALISVALSDGSGGGSPPTLTSPTGTKTGSTTAAGTVTTTEMGGTLYYRATTNASESAATVKAGSSVTVDALNESVSLTGLAASTTYRIHYLHTGANGDSAVVSSGTFTTDASSDSTPPTMNGSITVGTVASTSIQISWLAASDNSGGTLTYETSVDGGAFTDRGTGLSYNFTGLSASVSYTLRVRAKDPSGNVALTPLQVTQSTAAGGSSGTFTSGALARNNGAAPGSSLSWVSFVNKTTGAHVLTKTSVSITGGVFTVTDAAFTAGTEYQAQWRETGGAIGCGAAVAS